MLIALNCSVFCFILQQQRLSYSCPDARTAAASAFAAHRPPAPFANPFATTSTLICLAANRICLSYHSRCQRRSAQPDANRGCLRPQCRTCSGTCCTVEERTSLSLEPVLREPSLSCLLLQLFFYLFCCRCTFAVSAHIRMTQKEEFATTTINFRIMRFA